MAIFLVDADEALPSYSTPLSSQRVSSPSGAGFVISHSERTYFLIVPYDD